VNEQTGKAVSQAAFVTSGRGRIGGLNATADGKRVVLWRVNTQFQVFITDFDAERRRFNPPRRLTLDANGNVGEAWSWDSRAVFFVSNRNGTWKLFKQAIDQRTADLLVEGRSLFLPRLSADGSEVLYLAASLPDDGSHPVSIMRRSLEGGPSQVVLQDDGIMNYQCARAPSRLCMFSKMSGRDVAFLTFDPDRGEEHELMRMPAAFTYSNWTLSPDARVLAIFLPGHRIRFISLSTGAARDVFVKSWPVFNGDWTTDGKSLLMQSVAPDKRPVILKVDDTGEAEVVLEGDVSTRFIWLLQSRDGRYGLLEEQVPGDNNAWMIDQF
jgi:hypothetical protein